MSARKTAMGWLACVMIATAILASVGVFAAPAPLIAG